MRYLILLLAIAPSMETTEMRVRYDDNLQGFTAESVVQEYQFSSDLALTPVVRVPSRGNVWTARVQTTDAVHIPYDQEIASIVFEKGDGTKRYVVVKSFRALELRWVNDRLAYIDCNIGHVAGAGYLYDVEANA